MNAPERFADEPASPFLTPEHLAFRDMLRRFVATEIEPFATQWDEAGEFPRELYLKAASIGLLQLGFPEEYGGVPCDRFMSMIAAQELARAGAGGVSASLKVTPSAPRRLSMAAPMS
jgi:acyl-CoA dehydrogenase